MFTLKCFKTLDEMFVFKAMEEKLVNFFCFCFLIFSFNVLVLKAAFPILALLECYNK